MNKILILEGDINNAITGFRKQLIDTLNIHYQIVVVGSTTKNIVLPSNNKFYNLGPLSGNPFYFIFYLFKIFKIILKEKPIVCLSFNLRPNIAIGLFCKIIKIKTIATITGTSTFLATTNFFKNKLLNFIFSNLDYVFFQNLNDKTLFENQKIRIKNYIIVPGSGINTSKYNFGRSYKTHAETTFILVSRIIKEKGILEYIKAAEILKNKGYYAKFQLLGPYYFSGKLKDRIDKTIINTSVKNDFLTYLGETTNVIPYIINADCVVHPSYREGMSNLLLEAASLSTPIITTNVPGCKEIVENNYNGLLCNPRDSLDLADKLIHFIKLTEKERETMGKNGRIKVEKEFEKSIVINKYLDIVNILSN